MGILRASLVAVVLSAMSLGVETASAMVAPVGLLESVDVELIQGTRTIFKATDINTTGMLDGTPIHIDTLGGTNVMLKVKADNPGTALQVDRWMQFTVQGRDLSNAPANLFLPEDQGEIQLKITNMKFSNVDGVNGVSVTPFHPSDYLSNDPQYNRYYLPFFYILDEDRGFVNLDYAERYSLDEAAPYNLNGYAYDPSLQVPMYAWDGSTGYQFTQVDNGHLTGFALSGVPDFGTGTTLLTPVNPPESRPPYFGTAALPEAQYFGFASEISCNLNMRGIAVPEPVTLALLILPLFVRRFCRS